VTKRMCFISAMMVLIVPALSTAEVDIPGECRVANKPPGRCGWCALETLARRHGIKALYGLVEKQASQSRPKDLERVVAASELKYRLQHRGTQDTDILHFAVREDLGAVVGFRPESRGAGGHIVTLVDFGDDDVRYIDPNQPSEVRTMDAETFMDRWDGFALVLHRP